MKDYKIKFKKSEVNSSNKKKKGGLFMRHKKKIIGIGIASLLAVVALSVFSYFQNQETKAEDWIAVKFKDLEDLTVQEVSYSGEHKISDAKEILGWELPMTKNVIRFKYKGIIKVAYKLEKPDVDSINKTITFDLGEPKITDNYITEKKVYDEEVTLLNKIESDQIDKDDKAIMKEGEETSIADGLFDKTEEQAKKLIRKVFEDHDYKVKFKNSEGENDNEEL